MCNTNMEGGRCTRMSEALRAHKGVEEEKARKILPDLESLEFQA
jgi:hypothetical protein